MLKRCKVPEHACWQSSNLIVPYEPARTSASVRVTWAYLMQSEGKRANHVVVTYACGSPLCIVHMVTCTRRHEGDVMAFKKHELWLLLPRTLNLIMNVFFSSTKTTVFVGICTKTVRTNIEPVHFGSGNLNLRFFLEDEKNDSHYEIESIVWFGTHALERYCLDHTCDTYMHRTHTHDTCIHRMYTWYMYTWNSHRAQKGPGTHIHAGMYTHKQLTHIEEKWDTYIHTYTSLQSQVLEWKLYATYIHIYIYIYIHTHTHTNTHTTRIFEVLHHAFTS